MKMTLSENAVTVLERRYLKKDKNGKAAETPADMFRRVAGHIADADRLYDENADVKKLEEDFYKMMSCLKFMPNSPTLMNAGRELGQLSACFVLPVKDSMEDIFETLKQAALIHKSGGGTGFSFSRLRPKGASVRSTGGIASGPVSFMKVYNAATEAVKQGGTRRGANMGVLRVDHPDILEFITCKKDNREITNFNISVGITEAFMKALKEGTQYALVDPATGRTAGHQDASDVFDLIVEMAHKNGEPGIVFLDRLNESNPVPAAGEIESTNPCGEQPLLPFESCNLGSINLSAFVKGAKKKEVDYPALKKTVELAIHFLDNVIDKNVYPIKEIETMTKKTRKVGLGIMGFADMLLMLGIPYNSGKGIDTAQTVMKFVSDSAKQASSELARIRGNFPLYEQSVFKKENRPMRNATVTTIAPTGTISIICNTSSGIEPVFAISYIRNVMDDDHLIEVHPYFEKIAKQKGFYSKELMEKIAQKGTLKGVKEIPEEVRNVFVTAHDVSPACHVKMQAAFQKYTDNAVSKTVNFPKTATKDDVKKVYGMAYDLGLKGVTIYRDGSRSGQVLNIGGVDGRPKELTPRQRPETTRGITEKIKIGCGNLYVTVNYDEKGICEVFSNLGRAGGCPSQTEAASRLISIALRSGINVDDIIDQLRGIRCHSTLRKKDVKVLSCPDAIGRVLEKVKEINGYAGAKGETEKSKQRMKTGITPAKQKEKIQRPAVYADTCPECGSLLEHEGGCVVCRFCGYSKCG